MHLSIYPILSFIYQAIYLLWLWTNWNHLGNSFFTSLTPDPVSAEHLMCDAAVIWDTNMENTRDSDMENIWGTNMENYWSMVRGGTYVDLRYKSCFHSGQIDKKSQFYFSGDSGHLLLTHWLLVLLLQLFQLGTEKWIGTDPFMTHPFDQIYSAFDQILKAFDKMCSAFD